MNNFRESGNPHTFHIPVMGTGFTIDTPVHVARYGISSVVSIGDDLLIEAMRKLHSEKNGLAYEEITDFDEDARARRITEYLNLLNLLVNKQIDEIRKEPFEPGSEITKYYEMLPDSPLRKFYIEMLETGDAEQKEKMQSVLRECIKPGLIASTVIFIVRVTS